MAETWQCTALYGNPARRCIDRPVAFLVFEMSMWRTPDGVGGEVRNELPLEFMEERKR